MYFGPVVSLGGALVRKLEGSKRPEARHGKVFVSEINRPGRKAVTKLKRGRSARSN